MKISDEVLTEILKLFTDADKVYLESNSCFWQTSKQVSPERLALALVELQQLREERRWRDISKELPEPNPDALYQFSTDGKTNEKHIVQFYVAPGQSKPMWIKVEGFELFPTEKLIKEYSKPCWRPLPMDLPEKPVKKLPNLSDMVGICNVPDGTEYVRRNRDDLPEVE